MDLKSVVSGNAQSTSTPAQVAGSLKSDALFAKIQEEVGKNADKAKSVGGVFQYNITENGKTVKQWSEYKKI